MLEKEGFRYLNYIDIFDGGPTLECDIDRVRAIRKSRLVTTEAGETSPVTGRCAWWRMNSITSSALCWCMPIRMATP
ncbi:Arginine N-succinyltransferase [Klebsiella pneumoniae]|nr:Arginine N-succinyltransferase [Klebsiella pneumoniae]